MTLEHINSVTMAIIQRKRFHYKVSEIIDYLKKFLCFRNVYSMKTRPEIKKHFYFEKAEKKLCKELDVINLLKSIRNMKLMSQTLLTQRHRMLLKF
mmetsp:Transcript_3313/g.3290  ORF Transcript_3313/g.3290 Transcript_3313/m.3290 type:complete len:96 (+) Transcript_3313:784-1071(+)